MRAYVMFRVGLSLSLRTHIHILHTHPKRVARYVRARERVCARTGGGGLNIAVCTQRRDTMHTKPPSTFSPTPLRVYVYALAVAYIIFSVKHERASARTACVTLCVCLPSARVSGIYNVSSFTRISNLPERERERAPNC